LKRGKPFKPKRHGSRLLAALISITRAALLAAVFCLKAANTRGSPRGCARRPAFRPTTLLPLLTGRSPFQLTGRGNGGRRQAPKPSGRPTPKNQDKKPPGLVQKDACSKGLAQPGCAPSSDRGVDLNAPCCTAVRQTMQPESRLGEGLFQLGAAETIWSTEAVLEQIFGGLETLRVSTRRVARINQTPAAPEANQGLGVRQDQVARAWRSLAVTPPVVGGG